MSELPEGWIEATLGDLGDWTSGGTPSRKNPEFYKGDIPWVKTGNLRDGPIKGPLEMISSEAVAQSSAKLLPASSVLVAMYGATIGRLGILTHPATCNQACAALLPQNENLESLPFVYHYLRSSRERFKAEGKGGAQPNISQGMIKEFDVPLPPLNEQKRIVQKIDALTEKSREAREALDEVPQLLDKLRQSILAAAFRGDLTKKWREQNPDVEPASVLLERIRKERRHRWEEAELAKMEAKGKPPKDDKWKQKYKEPEPVDTEGLPELPEGWCWARLGEIGEDPLRAVQTGPFGALLHNTAFVDEGIPVIAVGNLTGIGFTRKKLYFVTEEKAEELARFDVQAGDLLFARSGATLGKVCVAPEYVKDWRMTGHILRGRLNQRFILSDLAAYALRGAPAVTEQVFESVRGATRPGYNTGLLESIALPLPPLGEQREIIKGIGEAFKVAEDLGAQAGTANESSTRLDASILAKAFRGELVPQDPNDEPASVLLERIRAEREAGGGKKTRKKTA